MYIFFGTLCIYAYICTEGAKNVYTSEGAKKMYTHFKRCYLRKMCIHLFGTLCICIYIYVCVCVCVCVCTEGVKKMYTHQRVPKKCIHILRDVIYVKCVYIFLAPSVYIYIYIYVQRVPKNVYTSDGAKKMYTHFKRCYLCKMCVHLFGTLCVYIYIYVCVCTEGVKKCIHIRGCQKNVYTF